MVNQRYINRKIYSLSYLILYANVHKGHLAPDGATTKYCIAATAAAVRERGGDDSDGDAGDGVGGGEARRPAAGYRRLRQWRRGRPGGQLHHPLSERTQKYV